LHRREYKLIIEHKLIARTIYLPPLFLIREMDNKDNLKNNFKKDCTEVFNKSRNLFK